MLRNYFKVAFRSIRKNKLYSFVNITGLAIGITGCILIGLYIWNEITYDHFHKNADRIARVTMEYGNSGTINKVAVTGTKVGPELKRKFPQIERFTRLIKNPRSVAFGTKVFNEKNVLYADADFFNIFSFNLKRGDQSTVLATPFKVVVSESTALKYFGTDDPIGKTIRINDLQDYEVSGIVADAPLNSQIYYDLIVSFGSLNASKTEEWFSANYITYVLLQNSHQLDNIRSQVKDYMVQVNKEELHATGNNYLTYHFEKLADVHLHSTLDGLEPNGNITYVYVLAIVAFLILSIACVNYTNLATAQSVNRGTEIGVRKVLGAGRKQLLKQFLGESFVLTFFAMILAFVLSICVLPLFNSITAKTFKISVFFTPLPLLFYLVFGVAVSFIAGAYPALVLSNSGLASILKSGVRVSTSGGSLRKSLIVFQFVISVFLVMATLIVLKQVSFIQSRDLGYERQQVLVLPIDSKTHAQYSSLKQVLTLSPGVQSVSGAYEDPTFIEWGDGISADAGKGKKDLSVTALPVDIDFIKTMGMHLVSGRDFSEKDFLLQDTSKNYLNFKSSFIINEKAASELGWSVTDAIGKTISRGTEGNIVGVVRDFNFASLHTPIGPLVIFLDTSMIRQMFIKVKGQNLSAILGSVESAWKSRITHRPFDYHFLDEDFDHLYLAEHRTASLFLLFSGLAIVLACMGLFGLAAFTTVQRTKEIGIRKILGADPGAITLLVSRQFMLLVTLGIFIACPLAWWAGNRWLEDFAFRVHIGIWIFVIAGMLALVISILTVSYHAIKASLANPVNSLRQS